jgi:hypothetical protein
MSLGPGHVQRKLAKIFAENKGGALTRSAVLRAAKSAAWKAGWTKLHVYDMSENIFVEVTNPLAGKFGSGMPVYAIAHFVGASPRDVRGYLVEGTIPRPSLSVETGPKLLTHNTYQGGKC